MLFPLLIPLFSPHCPYLSPIHLSLLSPTTLLVSSQLLNVPSTCWWEYRWESTRKTSMLPLRYVSSCYFTSYFLSWTHATPFLYTYSNPPTLSHTHTHTPKPPPLHTHTHVCQYTLSNMPHPLSTHTCTHISSQPSFPRVLSSSHPHRPTIWCQSAGSLTPPRPSSTLEHVALSSPAASLSVWKKIALRLVHRTPMGKCETNTRSVSCPHVWKGAWKHMSLVVLKKIECTPDSGLILYWKWQALPERSLSRLDLLGS